MLYNMIALIDIHLDILKRSDVFSKFDHWTEKVPSHSGSWLLFVKRRGRFFHSTRCGFVYSWINEDDVNVYE